MNLVVLASAFTMGALGGSHCVVMCGGVVGMTCSALPLNRRRRLAAQLPYALGFNAGRIASYGAAGAVAGLLGGTVAHFGAVERLQLSLRFAAGLTMLAVGLYVAGISGALRWLERAVQPVWRLVAPWGHRLVPVRTPAHALALGLLWGWMPCGLVYATLATALATGSSVSGATTMIAFGLGTLPLLLTMGSAATLVARAARNAWVRRAAGLTLLAYGTLQLVDASRAWMATSDDARHLCCFLLGRP